MTIFFFDLASLRRLELPHPSELLGFPSAVPRVTAVFFAPCR
jgi:hypothetical protein